MPEEIQKPAPDLAPPPNEAANATALLQAEEFFEKNPFAYFLMRAGGRIVRVNSRFRELLGYEPSETEGKQIEDYIARSNVPELHGYHREKIRHRDRPFEYECNWGGKGGREIRAVLSMNIVTQGGFALGSLRDVTEERRLSAEIQQRNTELQETAARLRTAQEELQRTTQMATLGEVSGRMAHEILNPLTAVTAKIRGLENAETTLMELAGFVEGTADAVAGLGGPGGEQAETLRAVRDAIHEYRESTKKDLGFVSSELQRIQRLVDDMRGATKTALQRVKLSLFELVNYCRDVMQEQLERGGCAFISECPGDVWVQADRGELIQVITNLIKNAVEAMPEEEGWKREVRLLARANGNVAEVRIRDSGKGVPAEIAPLIFEPNFTTKKTGTGFGLAIARRLIRAHNGDVQLEAPPEGETGACFLITLPCTVEKKVEWEG